MMSSRNRLNRWALVCIAAGCVLRFAGLTRGASDFVLPEQTRTGVEQAFYHFHPDEGTVIRAALALDSPFHPPITVYGLLPLYLARGVLEVAAGWGKGEWADLDSLWTQRRIYYAMRSLSALLASATVGLVWLLGRRVFGERTALLGTLFVAVAPLAIQQAHFFTVDGVFVGTTLVSFLALLTALATRRYAAYVVAGALVGVAGAARLNGLLLVLLQGHLQTADERIWRSLLDRRLWAAGLSGLLALVFLQPYLVTDPGVLWRSEEINDFAFALQIARGKILRLWSLVDVHTIPYWHYWTHLWPLGVGWPLTVAFALGVGYALRRRTIPETLMVSWCVLYFLTIGGLHTKYVRYLLPLLPFLCLLVAHLCAGIWRWNRYLGGVITGGLVLYTSLYGLAFARIYQREDSRIQAARWVAAQVPAGARIGVEGGCFSLQSLISEARHAKRPLQVSTLFGSRGYLSCRTAVDYLQEQVRELDYIAVVDVNRYQQFTAVPELYPVAAAFYRRLWDEELGFILLKRFKVYPALWGLEFRDDGVEPSFIGYDHPAVLIFKRADPVLFERSWKNWRGEMTADDSCIDGALHRVAALFAAQEWEAALDAIQLILRRHPEMKGIHFIEAAIHRHLGDSAKETAAFRNYLSGFDEGGAPYVKPWASSMSLADLGLPDLAMASLLGGVEMSVDFPPFARREMARSYIDLGRLLHRRDQEVFASQVYQLATKICPESETYRRIGEVLDGQGALEAASHAYRRALQLASDHVAARANLGRNLYLQGDLPAAAEQFQRVLERGKNSAALFYLGLVYLVQGQEAEAEEIFTQAMAEFGPVEGVRVGVVSELRERVRRREVKLEFLNAFWPEP